MAIRISEWIKSHALLVLAFVFSFILNSCLLSVYDNRFFTSYNLLSFFAILITFAILSYMRVHNIKGGIIYGIVGLAAFYGMIYFIFSSDWSGFESWFLTGGETGERAEYFYALICVFPMFLATCIFYFTTMQYRTSFILLTSLIPCAVYVKVLSNMSDVYLALVAGMNVAFFCIHRKIRNEEGRKSYNSRAGAVSMLTVTAVVVIISSLIPKQGEAKYYDKFEKLFMNAGNGTGLEDLFRNLSERSGRASSFRELSDTPLYDVYTDGTIYLRRQTFDLYNNEEHYWYPLEKYSDNVYDDIDVPFMENAFVNYDSILSATKYAAEHSEKIRSLVSDSFLSLEGAEEQIRNMQLVSLSHPAVYVPLPERTISLISTEKDKMLATRHKQINGGEDIMSPNSIFNLKYYDEFSSRYLWMENGGADFTNEEYEKYLSEMISVLDGSDDNDGYNALLAMRSIHESAMEYKADVDGAFTIPERLSQLANELTAGCTYDWQKASALQDFFQNTNFVYDLDYTPPVDNDDSEFFVFESKRGTCSDFATAYTLMARAVGLTVRYTEGFSPDLTSTENFFRVRASGSHAYPEVYIQNMGWLVFEPTVASLYGINFGGTSYADYSTRFTVDLSLAFTVVAVFGVVAAAAAVVIFSIPFFRYVRENREIGKNTAEGICIIYRRLQKKLEKTDKNLNVRSLTARETGAAVGECFGKDISDFVRLYEKCCFNGYAPTENETADSLAMLAGLKRTDMKQEK